MLTALTALSEMVSFLLLFGLFMSFDYVALKELKVNPAIQTELELNKRPVVELVEKAQWYLELIKKILTDTFGKRKNRVWEERYKFTDFLRDSLHIIITFKDKEIKNVLDVIYDEFIRFNSNYNIIDINKHPSFIFLENNVFSIQNIRKMLNRILTMLETKKDDLILGFMNSIYKNDSEKKLKQFVNHLHLYIDGDLSNLDEIVREGIKNIFIKHYLYLDTNDKSGINNLITRIYTNTDMHENKSKIKATEEFHDKPIFKSMSNLEKKTSKSPIKEPKKDSVKFKSIGKFKSISIEDKTQEVIRELKHKRRNLKNNASTPLFPVTFKKIVKNKDNDYAYINKINIKNINKPRMYHNQSIKNKTKCLNNKTNHVDFNGNNKTYIENTINRLINLRRNAVGKYFSSKLNRIDTEKIDTVVSIDDAQEPDNKEIEEKHNIKHTLVTNKNMGLTVVGSGKISKMSTMSDLIDRNKVHNESIYIKTTKKTGTKNIRYLVTTIKDKVINKTQYKNVNTIRSSTSHSINKDLIKKNNGEIKVTETKILNNFVSSTTLAPITFDLNEFFNRTDIHGEDNSRKQEIEDKMKADLDSLFNEPEKNISRTSEQPDSFQELEKAFDFD